MARLFGVDSYKDVKHAILDPYAHPIPPNIIDGGAPCHEVVHARGRRPHLQLGPPPGGPALGARERTQISMYRMAFREGQRYASINMVLGGAGDVLCARHKGKKIPCTVNCGPPVGAELMAVGTLNPVIFPGQTDKIGMAGALQRSAIDLVKAKTVDAFAIAQSEWVLEGYVVGGESVWETDEAERLGRQGEAKLHPEWARYMGRPTARRGPSSSQLSHGAPTSLSTARLISGRSGTRFRSSARRSTRCAGAWRGVSCRMSPAGQGSRLGAAS